jgi:SAM-dependent methyltransferase
MQQFKDKYLSRIEGKRLLDVGSQDINGSYRPLFSGVVAEYVGADLGPGKGVDVVVPAEGRMPFEDASFDVVISGQTLEHAKKPWELVVEMARVLKLGGLVCWIAPWRFHEHKDSKNCPYDRWRILSDGMIVLIELAGLSVLEARMYEDDSVGIGEKRC